MPKIKELLNKVDEYKICLTNKNAEKISPNFEKGISLYNKWKEKDLQLMKLREKVNKCSDEFNKTKDKSLIEESKKIKDEMELIVGNTKELSEELQKIELTLPNWILEDIPIGCGYDCEKPIKYVGVPKVGNQYKEQFEKMYSGIEYEKIDYKPFHHYELVGKYIDQEKAGDVALSRFYYEFDEVVILDLAISMYAVEFFKNKGYKDKIMITPYMLKKEVEERITYFEAFEDTIFEIEKDNLLLIPSSEHSIVAYYADKIFEDEELPLRVMAWSPCFRREAGSHGIDTRGIFRVRQFHKVELHTILKKDEDLKELEKMREDVQEFLTSLGLPNRSVIVPSGDMDKRALKQIDIETWMPGQGKYVETHSIATLGTWVSEKLMMRYRVSEKKELVRNLYATAAAVQRLICAISENHYDAKTNSIKIPGVLRKYTMGIEEIKLDK